MMLPIVADSAIGDVSMNRLSRIVDFDGFNEECLARLKPGDEMRNACSLLSNTSDFSVEEADARWYPPGWARSWMTVFRLLAGWSTSPIEAHQSRPFALAATSSRTSRRR
jgi:hypothetical protein